MRVCRPVRPAKPRPPHQRRITVPTTATRRRTRAKTTRRAPTFKTPGVEGKAEPPPEPRVNAEIRCPTRAAELELNMSWLQFNAGPSAGTCHWLQFNAGPSARGAPPGCSGETCSLSGETKAPTATATRAFCHEARHNRRSLPHFRRRVSSGGALLCPAPITAAFMQSAGNHTADLDVEFHSLFCPPIPPLFLLFPSRLMALFFNTSVKNGRQRR